MSGALLAAAVIAGWLARPQRSGRRPPPDRPDRLPRFLISVGRCLDVAGTLPEPSRPADGVDLSLAGIEGVSASDLSDLRRGAVAAFGAVGAVAILLAPGPVTLLAFPILAVLGWLQPELWLRGRARRRAARIEEQAPLVLDLVAVSVAAGATVDAALDGAGAVAAEPLRSELRRLAASVALGARRSEELRELSARTGAPTVQRLSAALRRADRLGVPVAGELRAAADAARRERRHAVEERAAEAGPRILLVVVFLLVPAALLPVLTAVALSAMDALSVAV
jgi:tight adherence protein C